MSAHMRKPHTSDVVEIRMHGNLPIKFIIARSNSFKLLSFLRSLEISDSNKDNNTVEVDEIFKSLDKKYGKVGLTIRGLRIRDGLTQKELAKKLNIYQTHISQIEHGKRIIGKNLAQKLAKIFRTDYRLFL